MKVRRNLLMLVGPAVLAVMIWGASASAAVVSRVEPERVSLTLGVGAQDVTFTAFGTGLDLVKAGRVTRAGAVVPQLAVGLRAVPKKGDLLAMRVQATAAVAAASDYVVEINDGQRWMPIRVALSVRSGLAVKGVKPDQRHVIGRDALMARQTAKGQTRASELGVDPRRETPGSRLPDSLIPAGEGPEIQDYFPKDKGAWNGTLVLVGRKLELVTAVQVGEHTLPLAKQLPGFRQRFVYRLPALTQNYTGDLSYTWKTKLGTGTGATIPHSLKRGYMLVNPWTDFQPKVTLLNPESHYPYELGSYRVRFENIPGNKFSSSQERFRPGSNPGFIKDNSTGLQDVEFASGFYFFYGNQFDDIIFGKVQDRNFGAFKFFVSSQQEDVVLQKKDMTLEMPIPRLRQPVAYAVTGTWGLRDYLGITRTEAWGQTDGTSDMTPLPFALKIKVGVFDHDGDLAFRVASGPIGTKGRWRSNALQLNHGWAIDKVVWEVTRRKPEDQKDYKARVILSGTTQVQGGASRIPDAYIYTDGTDWPAQNLNEDKSRAMMYFDEFVVVDDEIVQDVGKDRMRWFLRPFDVTLGTDVTAVNDHWVMLKLKSITFLGPAGKSWRDAISRGVDVHPSVFSFMIGETDLHGNVDSTLKLFQTR